MCAVLSLMLPYFATGNPRGKTLVFVSGFPDDELSGWAPMIEPLKDEYFLVSVCFPGNEKNGKPRPWGYTVSEIVDMLDTTLTSIPEVTEPFTLITHDWGAVIGYLYENRFPHKVTRMIAMDIGLNMEPQLRILFYQLWFAATYVITQFFGMFIGKIPFWTIFILFEIFPFLSPLGMKGDAPKRPRSELRPDMCYPYYQIWKHLFSQKFSDLISMSEKLYFWGMPSCPILFLYGKKKNAMFHGPKFLENITKKGNQDQCSKYVAIDAGHWMMHQNLEAVLAEMKLFVMSSEKMM